MSNENFSHNHSSNRSLNYMVLIFPRVFKTRKFYDTNDSQSFRVIYLARIERFISSIVFSIADTLFSSRFHLMIYSSLAVARKTQVQFHHDFYSMKRLICDRYEPSISKQIPIKMRNLYAAVVLISKISLRL